MARIPLARVRIVLYYTDYTRQGKSNHLCGKLTIKDLEFDIRINAIPILNICMAFFILVMEFLLSLLNFFYFFLIKLLFFSPTLLLS